MTFQSDLKQERLSVMNCKNNYFQNAEWIFVQDIPQDTCNAYFDYKAEFEVDEADNINLYISASTLYAVYVNDIFVDCGQYADYEDYQVYDELDISSFVHQGRNSLKIVHYLIGANYFTHRIQLPGVIFAIWQGDSCLLSSNEDVLSRKNMQYQSGAMEYVSAQLGFVFKYDACAESTLYQRSVLAGKEKKLFERPIKKLIIEKEIVGNLKTQGVYLTDGREKTVGKMMQETYLSSRTSGELLEQRGEVLVWHTDDEVAEGVYFVLDAGQESVGFLHLDMEVPEACDVYIGYGEHLEDMRVRTSIKKRNFAVSYHAHAGRNVFFNPFLRMGMRYMQIHIASKQGVLYKAGIRNTYYPLQIKENSIRDALHHKIYDVGVRTLHMCMHEHYEDCPWREQSLYTFDSRVQMLCGYYAFGEYQFVKESLRLLAFSLREDGMLELCAPGKIPITIPSFTTVFIRQLKEYLEYSKDVAFIQEMFEYAKKIVQGFEAHMDHNGLVPCYVGNGYWNFYEWRDGLAGEEYFTENPPYECPLNAMISDSFYCFARLCDVIEPRLAVHYDALHKKLNENIHQTFFDAEKGVYITRLNGNTEQLHAFTQALTMYVGATPDNVKNIVVKNMLETDMIPCSLSASIYEYDVLLQMGDTYRDYVRKQVEDIWGRMLYVGATTFWETDGGAEDFHNAGSLCHGWSAVPIYLYGKYNLLNE